MAHSEASQTPQLATVVTGPLQWLEKQVISKQALIEAWFRAEWQKSPAPLYGSVDLRNAGFKLAPVDMNLFPAGFNNLHKNPEFITLSVAAAKKTIRQLSLNTKRVMLIPESHTRNPFYWENVSALCHVLTQAGFDVRIGTLNEGLENQTIFAGEDTLRLEPLLRQKDRIVLTNFDPDFILLNNDLSDGIPDILQGLSQPMSPPAALGWSQRLKSEHFHYYNQVSTEFASLIQIDPWLVAPLFEHCGEVDFMRREGEECVAHHVDSLLKAIKQKYTKYGISYDPYVVIKADAGTYGMAITMVRSVDDVLSLNRKQRTNMAKSKGGQPVRRVIIQEGVHTFETWGEENAVAEPVVYMWGEQVVGGFYRVHKSKGVDENLNSPGMHFEPLVFPERCHEPTPGCQNRFYAYGVVARLSMLAAAREILDQKGIS